MRRADRAVADVAAVLRAVEVDAVQHLVGVLLRGLHRVGQRGHAQHAAAGGDERAVLLARCRHGTPWRRRVGFGRPVIASPLRGASG